MFSFSVPDMESAGSVIDSFKNLV